MKIEGQNQLNRIQMIDIFFFAVLGHRLLGDDEFHHPPEPGSSVFIHKSLRSPSRAAPTCFQRLGSV